MAYTALPFSDISLAREIGQLGYKIIILLSIFCIEGLEDNHPINIFKLIRVLYFMNALLDDSQEGEEYWHTSKKYADQD